MWICLPVDMVPVSFSTDILWIYSMSLFHVLCSALGWVLILFAKSEMMPYWTQRTKQGHYIILCIMHNRLNPKSLFGHVLTYGGCRYYHIIHYVVTDNAIVCAYIHQDMLQGSNTFNQYFIPYVVIFYIDIYIDFIDCTFMSYPVQHNQGNVGDEEHCVMHMILVLGMNPKYIFIIYFIQCVKLFYIVRMYGIFIKGMQDTVHYEVHYELSSGHVINML